MAIYRAIQKYGWENFEKDWYECPDEDLDKHEELMIEVLGTLSPGGYNLTEGGANGKHSTETRQKMSESQSGRKHTEKTKQKISKSHIGLTHTPESRQKISEVQIGKTASNETKQKMSEAHQGEKNPTSKRVYQYDLDGAFIGSFASAGEAGRHLKKDGTTIKACARGEQKTSYNFKWSYDPPLL